MNRAEKAAYAYYCSDRPKPIRPKAELIIDRLAEHLGITRAEAGELPLLAAVAVWREIREGWEPRQPVCCWCGDDICVDEPGSRIISDGWECASCRTKQTRDEGARLTTYERCVMLDIGDWGKRYAGSGTGALFDAAWELKRRGLLRIADGKGPSYLEFTDAGRETHASIVGQP